MMICAKSKVTCINKKLIIFNLKAIQKTNKT